MIEQNRHISNWLLIVSVLICFMVVFGGLVRLTSSGLSIVEWQVVTGVVPPLSEAEWQQEFEKYQQSPEYKHINSDMRLDAYKFIYFMEWGHRLLGRMLGIAFVFPFLYFWLRKHIEPKRIKPFIYIGLLLAFQGIFGWFMVQSGLVDRPHVSHLRLTGHLLLAILLLALTYRTAFIYRFRASEFDSRSISINRFTNLTLVAVVLQLAFGGMVAGLNAGTVSHTWPMMEGRFFPVLGFQLQPWYLNIFENPVMVHFIHRWFAIIVLVLCLMLWRQIEQKPDVKLVRAGRLLVFVIAFQVVLGVITVLTGVPIWAASLHQTGGLGVFLVLVHIKTCVQLSGVASSMQVL